MKRVILLATAVVGCSRDLSIPSTDRVTISPPFAASAPRDVVPLSAAGGAGGYTFAFASGGKLSGSDATIDPVTGAYRAGALGSAQDLVQVTDRAGSVAAARITVGPRLAVAPTLAVTAPHGAIAFAASGGKPPYTFSLVSPVGGSTLAPDGTYTAGLTGNIVEQIVVTDATGDAVAAAATADVHVGPALQLYRASTGAVAPNESVNFVGLGGQPPYVYSMALAPSGGAVSTTGTYQAGATGNSTDVVQVTDANLVVATAQVLVGAPLAIDPPAAGLRPGEPTQIVARNGKAPYAFAFRPKGNRSQGTLDAITGAYTPGPNFGAVDLVQVTDATATTVTRDLPPIGPLRLHLGVGVNACVTADFNGDGRDDLLFFQDQQFTSYSRPRTAAAQQETYFRNVIVDQILAGDFNGDNHGEVAMMQGGSLGALVPDLAGNLSLAQASDGKSYVGPLGFTAEMAAPIYTGVSTQFVVSEYTSGTLQLLTWPNSASGPNAAWTSIGPGGPPTSPQLVALAAGDIAYDGFPDVAWLGASSYPSSNGPLNISYGNSASMSASTFALSALAFPATYSYAPTPTSRYSSFSAVPSNASAKNVMTVLRSSTGPRNRLALAKGTGKVTAWAGSPLDPFPGDPAGTPGVTGFTWYSGIVFGDVKFIAWNEVDGRVADVRYDGSGNLTLNARAPIPPALQPGFPVTCATAGDVNGDGLADLALASVASPTAEVYWADGDGGFGRRARFGGVVPPKGVTDAAVTVADVDGDGLADVVTATESPGLAVLFGGGHQLAWGGESPVSQPINVLTAGNFRGDGTQSVVYQEKSGAFRIAAGAASGAFGVPGTLAVTNPNGTAFTTVLTSLSTAASTPLTVPAFFSRSSSTLHAFRMNGTTAATRFAVATPASTSSCSYLPVGLGIGRVAALCNSSVSSDMVVYQATLGGAGASEAYLPYTTSATYVGASGSTLPAGQLADGSAVFLAFSGANVYAITVAPGGAVTRTLAGAYSTLFSFFPATVAIGLVDGDAVADLVVSEPYGNTVVLKGFAGGTYAKLASYSSAGKVLAVTPLLAPGAQQDVLLVAGTEIVPLVNLRDGTGTLQ